MDKQGATTNDLLNAFLTSPDWLLQGVHGPSRQYHFAAVSEATYRESSFLDHRMQPASGDIKGAEIAAINNALDDNARPANYIFHSAFCCSTLFSNCLQFVSNALVLKEPKVLGHLSDGLAQGQRAAGFDRSRWHSVLAPNLRLLEKTYPDQTGVIIKPSNSANNLIQDVLALRNSPALFMHGSLQEFLLSNLKDIEASRHMVPLFLQRALTLTDYAGRLQVSAPPSHLQQCALLWHSQVYQFSTLVAAGCNARFLSASDFLKNPAAVLSRTLDYFDLPADDAKLDTLVSDGPLSQHAKSGDPFDGDARAAANEALLDEHKVEIQEVLDWMEPHLQSMPVTTTPSVADED